jgi:hypothetical protein
MPDNRRHVITVNENGELQFTRNPELEAMFEGRGEMARVTDIQKVTDEPKYYIKWMLGPYAGEVHDYSKHLLVFQGEVGPVYPLDLSIVSEVLLFGSYAEAVAYEVECLNRMRLSGVTFA